MAVRITKNAEGLEITSTSNPKYGFIRVEESRMVFKGRFATQKKRSALIIAEIEALQQTLANTPSRILPGHIVIREQLTPVNPEDTEYGLKIAGQTGVICRVEDQPIYIDTFYSEDPNETDVFIQHTNKEEIKAAQAQEVVNEENVLE